MRERGDPDARTPALRDESWPALAFLLPPNHNPPGPHAGRSALDGTGGQVHPKEWAARDRERTALIFAADDRHMSYGELDDASNRVAQALRASGLCPGDGIAVVLGNTPEFFEIYWGAMRAGLYFTPINWHLTGDEMAYIVTNSDARALFAAAELGPIVGPLAREAAGLRRRIAVGGAISGFDDYATTLAAMPATPIADESEGSTMLYSSGTTGRPKGVRPPLPGTALGTGLMAATATVFQSFFEMRTDDRYLCPGPLYHAAPLSFSAIQHRIGAAVVVMEKFTPEGALRSIERHRVTTSQWVPTHFNRMLSLPESVRMSFDLSSLRVAIHAAAPCPIPVKERMIAWWGPKLVEYYAGTEGGGSLIRSEEWLSHRGSVGRHWAGGTIHILDDEGRAIDEPGRDGLVYFEGPESAEARFRYHKDADKTADTWLGRLFTLGDIGHLDAEGYLYLTDRKSHMIISGGVNIYPQEVEHCLVEHPAVEDIAVIGVPHEDMGEEVKAIIQLRAGFTADPALAAEIIDWTRQRIAHFKAPRSVAFLDELPRQENGKIYKRRLRELYAGGASI